MTKRTTRIERPAEVPATATIEAYCRKCKATRCPDTESDPCQECGGKLQIKGWWY